MSSDSPPLGLRPVADSPVAGLALYEHRSAQPRATVICVHGGLDRGGSFSRLARRLEGLDVVAYDRRGYQRSRALGPGTLVDHVTDLLAVAEAQSREVPLVVLGHSFGGLVGLVGAIRQPSLCDRVVAFEAPVPWILAREGRPLPQSDPALEAEAFFKRVVSPAAWERLSEPERESRRLDGPALLADLETLHGESPADFSTLKVPSLLLHGEGPIGEYAARLGERLADLSPAVVIDVIAGSGHGAHLSHPGALAARVESWALSR